MKLQSSQNGSNFVCEKGTFSQIRSHIVKKKTLVVGKKVWQQSTIVKVVEKLWWMETPP